MMRRLSLIVARKYQPVCMFVIEGKEVTDQKEYLRVEFTREFALAPL